ncbi:MAG: MBL fold metallo-hydrolase [Phenylobacterium sp.]|uniref:MBL fold metallo-hydrolase n=1 Tax=Phenylobacterium sp. TaxID=1871053 RepID=UPI001A6392E1|nr:MBL fold metallo-hydrolase [Phenylobacterium sp.]MBL8770458.1 MBL fold metallo-hydrolase [Phenylobacterium sp.]
MRFLLALILLVSAPLPALAAQAARLKVTVLSTMMADQGVGEWGYAALVEVDGRKILYDTGARPETVLANARELKIDLSDVEDVVLSHHHGDHTGGFLVLRKALAARNPKALTRVHVAEGFFLAGGQGYRPAIPRFRADLEAAGATFIVHKDPVEIAPGVWLTGPVPRETGEKNYPQGWRLAGGGEDDVPEDMAMVFDTADGVVALSGCGHAGVVNIVRRARSIAGGKPLLALIGGLHTFALNDERLDWTGAELRAAGVRYMLLGHCTGIEATLRLRQATGLTRRTAAYGATGATYELGKGIDARPIAG